ncbi:ribosome maturation factor RimM [Thermasporomyces composti]|jgi:16S rRNA processing protein RimM|uniref:Ribosome maturation factor RimM n=1 Tax=Thermasporomyces composti TaxID=696763 RepID=A0A3D9V106_THECX|nr:ribosome maturation factor RimM [Thermasporomyces composti]REF35197.1 16S rRNA processing protein RimM [Thermasporomyces composti]
MEVVVGRVGRAHGVRGEVAVDVRTDTPELRFAPGVVFSTEAGQLTVRSTRWHGSRLLVSFEGIHDRTAAERLRGVLLVADVPEDERLEDPDEFYDFQLVGLGVRTVDGEPVGEVTEVVHLPMQELLAVRRDDGSEVLVPFVSEIVPDVDLGSRTITIDPPPGLLSP